MNRFIRNLRAPVLLCLGLFFLQAVKSDAQTFRGTILGTAAASILGLPILGFLASARFRSEVRQGCRFNPVTPLTLEAAFRSSEITLR
jgi:hypothetical protein